MAATSIEQNYMSRIATLDALNTSNDLDGSDANNVSDDTTKTDTTTVFNPNNYNAAKQDYIEKLRSACQAGILRLKDEVNTHFSVTFYELAKFIAIGKLDINDETFYGHELHYGKLGDSGEWSDRVVDDEIPFKIVQMEMASQGFYLLDISDHGKSKKIVIKLYCHKPSLYGIKHMWHGYDRLTCVIDENDEELQANQIRKLVLDRSNKKMEDEKRKEEKIKSWKMNLNLACNVYKDALRKACIQGIKQLKKEKKFCVTLSRICVGVKSETVEVNSDKYPFNVLHYGHVGKSGHWCDRQKWFECDMPFAEIQKEMLKQGYYLLDISDHNKSHRIIINLYRDEPDFYGMTQLWHGLDMIQDD